MIIKKYKRPSSKVQCKYCEKIFEKENRAIRSTKKRNGNHFCTRSCSSKDKMRNKYGEFDPMRDVLNNLKKRAIKKELENNLSRKILHEIIEKQNYKCAITGVTIFLPKRKEEMSLYQASVDRLDSGKGYVVNNIQFVSLGINYMKNKASIEEVEDFIKNIKNRESD